jgi:hypothetical protein
VADGLLVQRTLQEQPVDQRLQAAGDLRGMDAAAPLRGDFADQHGQ